MNRISSTLIFILFFTTLPSSVFAVSDVQFKTVRSLGELNGAALNCKYIDETRRMKRSLVSTVPQLRVIGQAFDQSTNSAFLTMIKSEQPCPDEYSLSRQVDQAIQQLEQAFTSPPSILPPNP